jgi:peptidoglycan hydrolase-like protein with peptidoglycan-binding domain
MPGSTSSPSAVSSPALGGLSTMQARSLQEALRRAGHDPGQVDGVIGPRTQEALRAFQQEKGLSTEQEAVSELNLPRLQQGRQSGTPRR